MNNLGGPELAILLAFFFFILVIGTAIQAVAAWFVSTALRRLPPEHQLMKPEQAWLLLIPIFNLFWNFVICTKAPRSFKSFYDSQGRTDVGDCGYGVGLAYAICSVASAAPIVICLAGPASLVLLILFIVRIYALGKEVGENPAARTPVATTVNCLGCGTLLPLGSPNCTSCGRPVAQPAAASRGIPIVVIVAIVAAALVMFLAVVGIIAAVAIPNLLRATEKGKQSRAMVELREMGTALEQFSIDQGQYPPATEISELRDALVPTYARTLNELDPWGHPYQVQTTDDSYIIYSMGKDGLAGGCEAGVTSSPEADICFSDGKFIQEPQWLE